MRPHSTKNQRRKPGRRAPVLMILVGAALLALVGALFALTRPPAPYTPEVTGSPNLKVDREVVDLGDVKLGTPEKVVFHLQNTGDQPLRFSEAPYIEVKEGCWPPEPVIGSMTLQPGQTTTVSLEFMMHGDMGGKHDFRLHLASNDPSAQNRELTVRSNWVP